MSRSTVSLKSETNVYDGPETGAAIEPKTSYVRVTDEWLWARVDINGATTASSIWVSTVPSILGKIRVETALSAHAIPIYNGTTGTTVMTLAASKAAETIVDMSGTIFDSDIQVRQSTTTQTGVILVQYRII